VGHTSLIQTYERERQLFIGGSLALVEYNLTKEEGAAFGTPKLLVLQ